MKESKIQADVIKYLESLGGWVLNVAGGPEIKRGTPDLLVCLRGMFWAVELKRPGKMPEAIQVRRMQQIARSGGLVFLWDSIEDAKAEAPAVVSGHSCPVTGPGTVPHVQKKINRNR